MMKRFTCILLITTAIAVPFLGQLNFNVYAADTPVSVNRDEMTQAFIAYCKSRDLTIDGSVLDAVDNFTSDAFQGICNTIGIDMTALQAEINKVVDPTSNSLKYFVFTATGINGFNRIFAQFLLDNDLAVGDEDVVKVVKSGKWFEDSEGNGCWVYILQDSININVGSSGYSDKTSLYKAIGTTYRFNNSNLFNIFKTYNGRSENYYINGLTYYFKGDVYSTSASGYQYMEAYPSNDGIYSAYRNGTAATVANLGIFYKNGKLALGADRYVENYQYRYAFIMLLNEDTSTDEEITVTSPDIKPDLPEDPTNIAPDGNYTPSDQDPTEPPPDPTGGTPPDWSLDTDVEPDGDGWKIPFSLPDLDIDWKIEGLSKKFPFCIPKDIVMVVNVLNVPAQAPRFTGTVDLFIYEWDVDIDFSDFDTLSEIVRHGIFILFCVGLLVITRTIIRG